MLSLCDDVSVEALRISGWGKSSGVILTLCYSKVLVVVVVVVVFSKSNQVGS